MINYQIIFTMLRKFYYLKGTTASAPGVMAENLSKTMASLALGWILFGLTR